jgi:hypothetical protein
MSDQEADCGQMDQHRAQRESFVALFALAGADVDKLALELGDAGDAAEHGHSTSTVSSVFSLNSILSGISVIA